MWKTHKHTRNDKRSLRRKAAQSEKDQKRRTNNKEEGEKGNQTNKWLRTAVCGEANKNLRRVERRKRRTKSKAKRAKRTSQAGFFFWSFVPGFFGGSLAGSLIPSSSARDLRGAKTDLKLMLGSMPRSYAGEIVRSWFSKTTTGRFFFVDRHW